MVYSSAPDESDTKWFYWTIHIKTIPENSIDEIAQVIYHLHPTFSAQKIPLTNREEGFKIYAKGWGRFKLKLEIVRKDGKKMKIEYQMPTEDNESTIVPITPTSFS